MTTTNAPAPAHGTIARGAGHARTASGILVGAAGLAMLATYALVWHTFRADRLYDCTGFQHYHRSPVPVLAGVLFAAAGATLATARSAPWQRAVAALLTAVGGPLFLWWSINETLLEHMFSRPSVPTLASSAFDGGVLTAAVVGLLGGVATLVERVASRGTTAAR